MLTGCASNSDISSISKISDYSSNDNTSSYETDDTLDDEVEYYYSDDTPIYSFEKRYEKIKEQYPDKSVLVWLTDSYVRYETELNQYLVDNDYDYVICFKTLDMSSDYGDTYITEIKNMSEEEVKFDILDSFSVVLGSDVVSNSYYYLAENDLYAPLDTYLTSDKYADIYTAFPQKYWGSYQYGGHIYGVDNSFSTLCADSGLLIYDDVLTQSGLSAEDFLKPLDKLAPAFEQISKACDKPFAFSCEFWTNDIFPANYPTSVGIALSGGKAVNVFEQDEMLDHYKLLKKYADKNYITVDSPAEIIAGYNIERRAAYGKTVSNDISAYTEVFNKQNNYICSPTNAVGVYSGSENKDLAADALLNILYNKDINNVITYGVEGVQYDVQDGKAVMKFDENGNHFRIDAKYNNPDISYSGADEYEVIVPTEHYAAYENAEYLDGCGFLFDGTDIKDKYINVVNKICEFAPPYADENSDIEMYIGDFNEALYSAGLQDILDEVNRQLEEYNETHNTDN